MQTFIWLSGLGPRGARIAWGSVSQTHTDGWARGTFATLYWVSYDYPALPLANAHTHRLQRETVVEIEKKSGMDGGRGRLMKDRRREGGGIEIMGKGRR